MKHARTVSLLMIFALVITVFSGCGSSTSSASSASSSAAPVSSESTSSQEAPASVIKVGVAMASVQSTAFQAMADTLKETAEKLGGEAIVLSAEHNLERQIDQVQDLITKQCNVIIINSVDAEGIVPVVEEAKKQGIKILAIDRKIATDIDYSIETDNVEAGRAAAEFFGEQAAGEEKEVLMLVSDPTATALRERQEGFKKGLEAYPNLKLVAEPAIGTSTETAYNATVDAFKANPDIRIIFTSGDIWSSPVQSALSEIGMLADPDDPNHVGIASVDGEKACLDAVREGKQDAVICQLFTDISVKCMETAFDLANGKEPATKTELFSVIVYHRGNMDDFGPDKLWGLAG